MAGMGSVTDVLRLEFSTLETDTGSDMVIPHLYRWSLSRQTCLFLLFRGLIFLDSFLTDLKANITRFSGP